jgi:hypothetical protein
MDCFGVLYVGGNMMKILVFTALLTSFQCFSSGFESLPPELQTLIVTKAPLKTILSICSTSTKMAELCSAKDLWVELIKRDYADYLQLINPENVDGKTLKDICLYGLGLQIRNNTSMDLKVGLSLTFSRGRTSYGRVFTIEPPVHSEKTSIKAGEIHRFNVPKEVLDQIKLSINTNNALKIDLEARSETNQHYNPIGLTNSWVVYSLDDYFNLVRSGTLNLVPEN